MGVEEFLAQWMAVYSHSEHYDAYAFGNYGFTYGQCCCKRNFRKSGKQN